MHFSSKRPCREIAFWAYISNRIFLAVGSLSWLPPFHQTNTTLFVWLLRPVVTCLVSASLPLYFSRPPRLLPQLLVTYSVRNFPRIATSSVQELFGKSCETIYFIFCPKRAVVSAIAVTSDTMFSSCWSILSHCLLIFLQFLSSWTRMDSVTEQNPHVVAQRRCNLWLDICSLVSLWGAYSPPKPRKLVLQMSSETEFLIHLQISHV